MHKYIVWSVHLFMRRSSILIVDCCGMQRHAVLWLVTYSSHWFLFSRAYCEVCCILIVRLQFVNIKESRTTVKTCYSLSLLFFLICIYTYIILILYVFHLDLDRMRSNISLFFDYSYNYTINCELFYVYGYTYLSIRARVINWFERARKRKLGKKTKKDEVWRMIQKL
jgi:hypothetical protein